MESVRLCCCVSVDSFFHDFFFVLVSLVVHTYPQVGALLTLRVVEDSSRLSDLFLEEFSLPARVGDALCNVGTHNGMWVWWGGRAGCVLYMIWRRVTGRRRRRRETLLQQGVGVCYSGLKRVKNWVRGREKEAEKRALLLVVLKRAQKGKMGEGNYGGQARKGRTRELENKMKKKGQKGVVLEEQEQDQAETQYRAQPVVK